jgi:EpsD family peptidyl-prolyl cis-trans isomerase
MAQGLLRSLLAGSLAACLLAACGPDAATPPGQGDIVARVNGEVITVAQLNERVLHAGSARQGSPAAARRQALDDLVDERLLVQKAMAAGLDQQPEVRAAIERLRTQQLARAAVTARGAEAAIADREVRAFFEANPNLFADRKVYTFRHFTIEKGRIDSPTRARLDSARTPAAVAVALKSAGLAHVQFTQTITAEALPPSVLAQAARMATGDILMLQQGRRTVLLQLAGSVTEPLSLEAASPAIEDYLADARRRQKAEQVVKDLRRKAKIEYVTQTAASSRSTELAEGSLGVAEPPLQKPLQTRETTVVR